MLQSDDLSIGKVQLSRRKVLLSGAVIIASGLVTSVLPSFAVAPPSPTFSPFMQLSRLLVNHQLDDAVGQRMLTLLESEESGLLEKLNQLLAIARANKASIVEDFFQAIPQGALQALAHKIIFGWYTGSLTPVRTAKTFAYEQALTWHTTLDVITIPSYGISGPNNWQRANTPVLPVPQF
ncbi:sugar dehydrogenase complex small subunit [Pantoea sp.]|uniref:sugar dehydrogenase complex small subunit n=1 Tax=Pantoea sp. TaxID=69393 RepID=UPI0028A77485|nr:sugar dehydrogenase complex small subunit [Pantoea sp.]